MHGFSGSTAVFNPIFSSSENLKEFFLVRCDVRGYGRSDGPSGAEGYSSQRFAEDFDAVSKAFGVKKPILWHGSKNSYGYSDVSPLRHASWSSFYRAFYGLRQQDNAKVFELLLGGFPTLLVHGTHDAYISSEKLVEALRFEIADLKVKMIEGASHAPFLEKPKEVAEAI
ncbi:hypothetical protein ACEPAI_7487 [Sanghuangporus weigelae]